MSFHSPHIFFFSLSQMYTQNKTHQILVKFLVSTRVLGNLGTTKVLGSLDPGPSNLGLLILGQH